MTAEGEGASGSTRVGRTARGSGSGPGEPAREGRSHWAGEPLRVWERRWEIPLLEVHDRLGSTNDRLRELARAGAPAFSVVTAEEQTAGRGRGGRRWHSPPGLGLWMSVLVPREPEGRPPLTPLLVGVAVCRALAEVVPEVDAGIKWPNDVLVEGRKVCGILCEGEAGTRTVAGVGLNVHGERRSFPDSLGVEATTLEQEAGRAVRRPDLAGALLASLRTLLDPPPEALDGSLGREVEALDRLRGRPVVTEGGVRGRAAGIAGDGTLLVEDAGGGTERVVTGSVRLEREGER